MCLPAAETGRDGPSVFASALLLETSTRTQWTYGEPFNIEDGQVSTKAGAAFCIDIFIGQRRA